MHTRRSRNDANWLLALLLVAAQLIISLVAVFLVWFQGMSSAGCDDACDYGLWYWSAIAFIAFAAVAFVATAAAILIWRRTTRIWVVPAVVIAATIAAAIISYRLGSIAFGV